MESATPLQPRAVGLAVLPPMPPKATPAPKAATTSVTGKKRQLEPKAPSAPVPNPSLLAELKCPISLELPVDPVTAEDGRVYERLKLLEYFSLTDAPKARSPVTGVIMGKTVVAAFQMRNTIERLVESKVIAGPEADRWKRVNEDFKTLSPEFRETVVKAHQGDVKAMRDVGVAYRGGDHGANADYKEAHKWFFKAAMQDEVASTTHRAVMLSGEGKDKHVVAAIEMTRAAMLGSEHACGCLALWFSNNQRQGDLTGRVAPCPGSVHYWYKRMRRATCLNSCNTYKAACNKHFGDHEARANGMDASDSGED